MPVSGFSKVLADYLDPRRAVLLFAASNFLFMGVDVMLAHSYNRFADVKQWEPIAFSFIGGSLLLVYAALRSVPTWARFIFRLVCAAGLLTGAAGFYFHVYAAFSREFSLKGMVYAAPLLAPLSYAGVALVALTADRVPQLFSRFSRRQCLFLLTGLGLFGNLLLTTLDHARNGFFHPTEWISVFSAAFSGVVLCWAAFKKPAFTRPENVTILAALLAALVTGLAGFYFHAEADWHSAMPDLLDKVVYGAPLFAPLLFADIASLGFLAFFMHPIENHWHPVL